MSHEPTPTRTCTHCHEAKPCTLEYFYSSPNTKSGLTSWCKVCVTASAATSAERLRKFKQRRGLAPLGRYQTCTKCKETYPRNKTYFPINKRNRKGYSTWCHACAEQHVQEYKAQAVELDEDIDTRIY